MRLGVSLRFMIAGLLLLPAATSHSAPLSIAGFDFPDGENDFAANAEVVSGTVTGFSISQVQTILTGSNISDSIRVIAPDVAEIELTFGAQQIVNESGPDAVVFELSGNAPVGTADTNERFEVSVLANGTFTPYQVVVPVATGYDDPADSTLDVFAVLLDLSDYGLSPGGKTDRIRIRLRDNGVTRSADPTAVGLLHSVPEPGGLTWGTLVLLVASALSPPRRGNLAGLPGGPSRDRTGDRWIKRASVGLS